MQRNFGHHLQRSREATRSLLTNENRSLGLPSLLTRLGDLTRSNAFLWAETGLRMQEQHSRGTAAGLTLSRSLVLATLAADLFSGYLTLRERARLWPHLVQERDWELQHQRGANHTLDTAASLGGAMIKACQFASTRPDLLPAVYIQTLARLQDRMPPHPWSVIQTEISQELGRNLTDVFAEIEPEPVAAASIAQVHRARLHDGRQVAVKIQYPEVASLISTDLALIERVLTLQPRVAPNLQFRPILDYLRATLPLELDFRREARLMTKLRTALRPHSNVVIPTVIPELSSDHLLVMEFMDGIKITERAALVKAGIDPEQVARQLNELYAEQMMQLGILHADPHPGNIFVQPGSNGPLLVLLDHGLTVEMAPALMHSLRTMVQSLTEGDFARLTQALVDAGLQLDEETEITTLLQLVGVLFGGSTGDMQTSTSPIAVSSRLGRSIGSLSIDLILVGRALGMLDGITRQLSSTIDVLEIIGQYSSTQTAQAS